MSLPLDMMTGLAARFLGSISGRRSPVLKENAAQERRAKALLHPQGYNVPELTEDRVRLVVFRDEKGVKTPVFDSQIHCDFDDSDKEPLVTKSWGDNMIRHGDRCTTQLTVSTGSEGWRGRRSRFGKKPSSDSELLGEMMFGSMPMKVADNTVKIHYIRSTDQLMLTKVFYLQRRPPAQCSLSTEVFMHDSCPLPRGEGEEGGSKNSFILSVTRPTDPPLKERSRSLMMPSSTSNGRSCLHSLPPHLSPSSLSSCCSHHSPPSPHTLSISSSYTRRKNRSRATSLEVGSELYRKVLKPLDRPPRKGRKYAIGVIITLSEMSHLHIRHFKDFLFSHFALINTHLERLREGVEEALLTRVEPQRQNVLSRAAQSYQSFLSDLLALYRARRIHSPVWLGLVSQQSRRIVICRQFMEELGSIVAEIDTKDTKFFFSTLLTAVLSHHLAWVYTVSHSTSDTRHSRNSKSLAVLAESHPYNPLWAQLGDMFGAVTQPLKVTRTIVTGQSSTLVCRLLYLLTYFIRCSEIQPGVVDSTESADCTADCAHTTSSDHSHTISAPSSLRAPHSSSSHTTLEDSGDITFESRASSAVTMCPSPHTPAAGGGGGAGKETPLVRTHPFSFRSPVPSTPEPHSHASSSHELHHSTSGSVEVSGDFHWRSLSTDLPSLPTSHTHHHHHKHPSDSLDRGSRAPSSAASWSGSAPNHAHATPTRHDVVNKHRSSSHPVSAVRRGGSEVGEGVLGESPLADLSIPSCPPEIRDSPTDQQGSTVEDDVVANSDLLRLPVATDDPNKRTWKYKKSKEMCASLASLESMGMCLLETDHVRFDVRRNYASDTSPPSTGEEEEEEEERDNGGSPCRIESFDSLSDLAGNSNTFSRNGSSNSIGVGGVAGMSQAPPTGAPFSSSLPHHPSHPHHPHTSHLHRSPTHHCGSIDSGYSYDNSIDISSLTDSSHTGISDSLFTGPRFSIGLNAHHHCNPEHSNIFMRPQEFSSETTTTPVTGDTVAGTLAIDDDSLRDELERTAMKRQESSASYVSSTVARPPTTQRSDTLDSNTTPVGGEGGCEEGEGGGTLTRRTRSGAFSYHGRRSTGDSSTLDSRGSNTLEREGSDVRTAEEVRRLARERGRQVVAGKEGEDEVFGELTEEEGNPRVVDDYDDVIRGENDVVCCGEVFWEPPEVLVNGSPELDSCWIAGEEEEEEEEEEGESSSDEWLPLLISSDTCPVELPLPSGTLLLPDQVDVEESLSPVSMSILKEQRSLLAERLQNTSLRTHAGLPSTPLVDFTEVELPSLEEFHLDEQDTEAHTSDPLGDCSAHTHTQPVQDFGHSLFAGHSSRYLPDFVLHGTSEPLTSFQPKLERHLASMVKHSTVDEPVEHGVAIIADTDNWTCRLMVATKDTQTNDVEMAISPVKLSRYVRLMMASFRGMWEMRMPPDFCLSHLEDRLLELNERGILLANNLMDHGNDVDLGEVLPTTFKGLSIRDTDETLLLSLAGVHCPDPDLTARLNYTAMRRTLATRK